MIALAAMLVVCFGAACGETEMAEDAVSNELKSAEMSSAERDSINQESMEQEVSDKLYKQTLAEAQDGGSLAETDLAGNETVEESRGRMEFVHKDFPETGDPYFYYEMEKFYVNDGDSADRKAGAIKAEAINAEAINDTLRQIYDGYEAAYAEQGKLHSEDWEGDAAAESGADTLGQSLGNCEYAKWHLLQVVYAGKDYISLQYNDISYMGGAHPYSYFDGITIDCRTGREIAAADILDMKEDEILRKVSEEMGLANTTTWQDIDFCLTDSEIVFFYRMPGYWDDVVWAR